MHLDRSLRHAAFETTDIHVRQTAPVTNRSGLGHQPGLDQRTAARPTINTSVVTDWYLAAQRELPWRSADVNAWGVLVSEVMSQQTPVTRVAPAWQAWMQRWPTPEALATASKADVIRAWDRLGYPRRAVRLQQAAAQICERFAGVVPSDYDDLVSLPGIGDYTASAVMAFAYQRRIAVLDTNVRRVLARACDGQELPRSSAPTRAERLLAEELLPASESEAAVWSVAVMELGALVCRAQNPACPECPLATNCRWRLSGSPKTDRPRSVQRFSGTDRQVRGKLLAVLRASSGAVDGAQLRECWHDDLQRDRCLDSLVADGLVEPLEKDQFRLPHE